MRRVLAVGATLVTTGVLSLALAPTPATASTITLNATIDCLNYNSFGDTRDWYPVGPSLSASPYGLGGTPSLVAVPATHSWQTTHTLPSGTTSVSARAMCSQGHQYDMYGSSGGITIPAGVTTVTATWGCTTAPVYPGPWMTNCSVQSVSYS
ncbi:hypothetical protein [Microbispora sp. H11081]|uniref:hypothetical protein n=1 Tax=Microbispora sp. H11081 TaxID=2729107 RepID=UPI00147365E1|nr:hypothetical protein [Microbispora sp. H11081]